MDPILLVTSRMVLRRLTLEDRESLLRYRNHPMVLRYQSVLVTAPDADTFITEQIRQPFAQAGLWTQIAITRSGSPWLIGDIGVHRQVDTPDRVDIGYTIDPDCQRRGYAYEAVSAVVDLLFSSCAVNRIEALIDSRNDASISLARKLGMLHHARQDAIFRGEPCLEDRFVLTKP